MEQYRQVEQARQRTCDQRCMTRRAAFVRAAVGGSSFLATAGLLAGACVPLQQEQSGAIGTGKAPVKVTYHSVRAAGHTQFDMETELFRAFNQSRPDIVVEVAGGPGNWDRLREKVIVSASGGDPVDMVPNGWGTWLDMADGGMLTELPPLFKRDRISTDVFYRNAADRYSEAGKWWGLPTSMSVDALAYNLDLFDAAGLKYPPLNPEDKAWTMERFLEYAQKLTRGREQFGFSGTTTGGWLQFEAGQWFGQAPFDHQSKKAMMDTPNFRKGVQYWFDLAFRHSVQPDAGESRAIGGFNGGKIGMTVTFGTFKKGTLPFRWGLATLPYSGSGRPMSGRAGGLGLHMGRTPRVAQVWEVFKWLMKPENGSRFALVNNHSVSPLRAKGSSDQVQKVRLEESGGVDHKAFLLQVEYSPLATSNMMKYPGFASRVDPEVTAKWKELWAQQISVADYCRLAADIVDRLLIPQR